MTYLATSSTRPERQKTPLRRAIPLALIILIVFFPTYVFGGLLTGQRILYLAYPLICGGVFLFVSFSQPKIYLHWFSKFMLGCAVVLVVTIVSKIGYISEHTVVTHLRYFAYATIFTLVYSVARRLSVFPEDIGVVMNSLFFLIAFFIALQFFNFIPGVLATITPRSLHTWRGVQIGGPIVWSYGLGFLLLPIFYFNLAKLTASKFQFKSAIILASTGLIFVYTQSKALYLAIAVTFAVFLFVTLVRRRIRIRDFFLGAAVLFLVVNAFSYVLRNIEDFGNINRFLAALQEDELDASTRSRVHQVGYAFDVLDINPLFGAPEERVIIENAYGYYLYNFGIIGLLVYGVVLSALLLTHWRILKHMRKHVASTDARALSIGMLMYVLGAFAISLAASPLDGHKSAYLFWTFNALYLAAVENMRVHRLAE